MLITDFVLLVSIFIGLLRLRHHGVGTRGLGLLLWKQVGCWRFLRGFSPSANVISGRQCLIWLFIATAAEVPPVVRPIGFLMHTFHRPL
jgi:hypothetical protein